MKLALPLKDVSLGQPIVHPTDSQQERKLSVDPAFSSALFFSVYEKTHTNKSGVWIRSCYEHCYHDEGCGILFDRLLFL